MRPTAAARSDRLRTGAGLYRAGWCTIGKSLERSLACWSLLPSPGVRVVQPHACVEIAATDCMSEMHDASLPSRRMAVADRGTPNRPLRGGAGSGEQICGNAGEPVLGSPCWCTTPPYQRVHGHPWSGALGHSVSCMHRGG